MRATVRVKLTALYGSLFLGSGAVLLTAVYLLVQNNLGNSLAVTLDKSGTFARTMPVLPATPLPTAAVPGALATRAQAAELIADSKAAAMNQLLLWSVVALLGMVVLSVVAGWWLSGRVLRPLHRITAAAKRLSSENLHERIDMRGPRDEMTELAGTFDGMLDRLETAFDSQRRFIANASHELRTPLTIQRAAVQIGLSGKPDEKQLDEVRDQLLTANRRVEKLIDGLLLLARSDRGLEHREPVGLQDVVEDAVHQYESEAERKSITVHTRLTDPLVLADRVLLTQLVTNLVSNAVRHNVSGGQIWVRTDSWGGLSVTNTGSVLKSAEVPELLEPFRRGAGRTGSADGGTGLGLSIVDSIVRAHGGSLKVEPRHRGGLRVRVLLPTMPELPEPARDRPPARVPALA